MLSDAVVWSLLIIVRCLLLVVVVWCWIVAIARCALMVVCCLSFLVTVGRWRSALSLVVVLCSMRGVCCRLMMCFK